MTTATTKTYNKPLPEITLKYKADKEAKCVKIIDSKTSHDVFRKVFDADTLEYNESVIALFLNRANNTIGWFKVSQGGIAGTVIDVRMILAVALKCGASSIIIAHNHPSGNLKPSQNDIAITKKLKESASLMDIILFDHLILTDESYYSFTDEGIL